jgi:hypothetical protein
MSTPTFVLAARTGELAGVTTRQGGDLRSWVGKYVGILKACGSNRSELANWEDPPPHFSLRGPDGAALRRRDVSIKFLICKRGARGAQVLTCHTIIGVGS